MSINLIVVLVLFIDIETSIQAKFADIDNVGYNISIETYHLTGTTIVFFIQIKYKI